MALYVAVCLLAALIALGEDADHGHVRAFGLVWGTTVGLALAHAFAFRVSARSSPVDDSTATTPESWPPSSSGATFVAAIATIPVVLVGPTSEFDVARSLLGIFIGAMGYAVARLGGARRARSIAYGGCGAGARRHDCRAQERPEWSLIRRRSTADSQVSRPRRSGSGEQIRAEGSPGSRVLGVDEPLGAEGAGEDLVGHRQEEVVGGDLAGVGGHRRPLDRACTR